MPDISLVPFDDSVAQNWEPYALTRPAGELLFGAFTLRERAEKVLDLRASVHLAADHLVGFDEAEAPPVVSLTAAPTDGARLFLLSRAVPDWTANFRSAPDAPATVRMDGEIVGWFAPAGAPAPPADFFLAPKSATPTHDAGAALDLPGRVLRHVWELVSRNPDQVATDIAALYPASTARPLPPGVHHWGSHPLVWDATTRIEPGVALDTTDGPIWLRRGVTIRAFTRLAGPAYVGPYSSVLGGSVESVSIGPVCRIRGELAESVCAGYVNKAHDGHIGHAYLGRWVNLGAETTNSDLKNNYGSVRIHTPSGEVDTGETKLGCFLGDHVKTGIGMLLNTGTVVGAGSNLYGAAMPPKYVAPFSWGTGDALVTYQCDKFMQVAERAMARREVTLTDGMRQQLLRAWERCRAEGEPDGRDAG
ncbi:MAG TPA: putative sugar nucleotidyl transferase [Longimicrobiaceae bacterium]|nr:putative sugar nucleotidyl transferase [Longimicrobiaceae bacterium]